MMTHKELDEIFYRIEPFFKKFEKDCISAGFVEKNEPQYQFLIYKRWHDLPKIEKAFVLWCLYNGILREGLNLKLKKIIDKMK